MQLHLKLLGNLYDYSEYQKQTKHQLNPVRQKINRETYETLNHVKSVSGDGAMGNMSDYFLEIYIECYLDHSNKL